jgi:hypothetical protein
LFSRRGRGWPGGEQRIGERGHGQHGRNRADDDRRVIRADREYLGTRHRAGLERRERLERCEQPTFRELDHPDGPFWRLEPGGRDGLFADGFFGDGFG